MKAFQFPLLALLVAQLLPGFAAVQPAPAADEPISLAGAWRFQLDRQDAGVSERWFDRALEQRIQLPGALQNQGFGDDISTETKWTANVNERSWFTAPRFEKYRQPGNVKVPFWLQPDKHYVGAAWYQRDIDIPKAWQGRRVVLTLERPHWETRVWLDDKPIGTNDSLSTPHVYDLGTGLAPGKHQLTIRVDNRLIVNVGVWAHSVSDHTQGNWNGLVGRLELSTTSPVWIDDIQVYPDFKKRSAKAVVQIGNSTQKAGSGNLVVMVGSETSADAPDQFGPPRPVAAKWDATGGRVEFDVSLHSKALGWDEFTPHLYRLDVRLEDRSKPERRLEGESVVFGLRDLTTTPDKLFAINGRKTFLRGTLECCIFPLTGYPPTDVAAWKRIIRIAQEHGLNHIRFHSWCPPEAAFIAADELGFYYQVEIAAWATVGSGEPQDAWLYKEAERILRAYGNHPSFLLMPYGNEPAGPKRDAWLAQWVNYWKARDTRRLYTSGSGWPMLEESQYHVTPGPRGPGGWIGKDYRNAVKNYSVPTVVHEMGQWCVYPNFDEIAKYTGPLKAKNFEIFRDSLAEHGLLDQWRDFLRASGKLQALCYKEEIEAAFRTPGVSGVQLLDLHDFPGQGTALVGVLDAFWDQKGYITPAEFRRFYNSTVPLARMAKRVWTSDETFQAELEVAHFGPAPMQNAVTEWKLVAADGRKLAGGELPAKTLPVDRGIALGPISVELAKLPAPAQCKLVLSVGTVSKSQNSVAADVSPLTLKQGQNQSRLTSAATSARFENDWTIWLYPSKAAAAPPADILVTAAFDSNALARLDAGGKVLLLATRLSPEHPRGSFTPVFWNRQWFPSQGCQTLGLLCNPQHPALAKFPTAFHSDWQWEDILTHSRGMVMDDLPRGLRPLVQVIDDWNTNRKLGLAFECRVGNGKLLVCSADLEKDLATRPAARQFRESLLAYMAGGAFNPQVEVAKDDLTKMLERTRPSKLAKLGARVLEADSEDKEHDHVAANAIDGDPDTIWHTRWQPRTDPMPHQLVIDLGREVALKGITYLPRQDMSNGRIAEAEIFCGNDPKSWGEPAARAKWRNTAELQTVWFPQPVKARYLKFAAKSEVQRNPFAAIAELDVVLDEK